MIRLLIAIHDALFALGAYRTAMWCLMQAAHRTDWGDSFDSRDSRDTEAPF